MTVKFRHPDYLFLFDIDKTLEHLKSLKDNIQKPFIMDAGTLNNNLFDNSYNSYDVGYYIHNSVLELMQFLTKKNNIWEICEVAFNEDYEWGEKRNKDLLYKSFYKYSLKDEYVKPAITIIDKWIEETEDIYNKMKEEQEEEKQRREMYKNKYSIIEVYKLIKPSGGENGQDGYYDGLIRNNSTGQTVRMVARNVFDFGFYTYPKRLEGTNDVFNREVWTEEERNVSNWICDFPPFTTRTRM